MLHNRPGPTRPKTAGGAVLTPAFTLLPPRIAAALYSQFGPGKFPANWWQVFACVVTYIVLTLALNIYSWQVEGDAFLLTKPFKVRCTCNRDTWGLCRCQLVGLLECHTLKA